jgi:hypothetical protein
MSVSRSPRCLQPPPALCCWVSSPRGARLPFRQSRSSRLAQAGTRCGCRKASGGLRRRLRWVFGSAGCSTTRGCQSREAQQYGCAGTRLQRCRCRRSPRPWLEGPRLRRSQPMPRTSPLLARSALRVARPCSVRPVWTHSSTCLDHSRIGQRSACPRLPGEPTPRRTRASITTRSWLLQLVRHQPSSAPWSTASKPSRHSVRPACRSFACACLRRLTCPTSSPRCRRCEPMR